MTNRHLTRASTDWREQIAQLQAELDELLPLLVEAEAELAERHATINAFEFRLRAAISHLTRKLDDLEWEISDLKRKLRWQGDNWYDAMDEDAAAWAQGQSATEEGDYRYREQPTAARPKQDEDTRAELKSLYRKLARLFHPDTAVDEADREFRTQMMMAINAAYAAGDLDKLKELAESPEAAPLMEFEHADQQQAEILLRELTRVKRRLAEIEEEIARLEKHQSARLMQEKAQAEAAGRDYLGEIEDQIRDIIARKMIIRDILRTKLESMDLDEEMAVPDEDFADLMWDVSLDTAFEEEISPEFDPYIRRRRDHGYYEEDFDDDYDFE